MLDEVVKTEIRDAYQQLTETRGLSARWGQRQMIAEVANALGDPDAPEPIAVVEAGTGTGKTIAYLVAALPVARARGKTLVVATATIALQEQLISKDLPDILSHSGLAFKVQLAKGRGRYVCVHKLDGHLAGASAAPALIPLYPDEIGDVSLDNSAPLFEAMLDGLAGGSWDGDLDSWPATLEPAVKRAVTTDHIQCGGRRCPQINHCSFFKARDGLQEVDVIVTNHDLVLSDLKLGGGAILPPPEDCIYIFDEGHQLPDKCLNHFMLSVRTGSSCQALRASAQWLTQERELLSEAMGSEQVLDALDASLLELEQLLAEVGDWTLVHIEQQANDNSELRFVDGVVPDELLTRASTLASAWEQQHVLALRLEARMEGAVEEVESDRREQLEASLTNANSLAGRAESQLALWKSYAAADHISDGQPWARWCHHFGGADTVEFLASPILASELLSEHLWQRAAGVVITSATLSALGRFDRFIQRSGVPMASRFKQVSSPFDTSRARFVVPALRSEPGDAEAHTAEIIALLPGIVADDQGVLVLFSSRKQMEAVVDGVRDQLAHELLVQDTLSKGALLDRHRINVDAGRSSLIMGLASFAEGIDLPGAYCVHVVIAKLPFAVPDSPLEAAHAELLERMGRNPFMEISVPDAAVKLVQAAGRLLRKEDDSGCITLLDRRIVSKRYGRAILDSLPRYSFELARS